MRYLTPVLTLCLTSGLIAATPHPFAQSLVKALHTAHPELEEIGIAVRLPQGCRSIASTDPSDVGEKCESEDLKPMQSDQPVVQPEGKELDLSMPLHDASGNLIGTIGIELIPPAGETRADTERRIRAIVVEVEKKIPSKAKLIS
ncbi:MAG TPA: PDC sensor domain-containing protein [Terriglobales bacterium]|nr:PDC sensor domain-containing protein [Terriglobales bacterium]